MQKGLVNKHGISEQKVLLWIENLGSLYILLPLDLDTTDLLRPQLLFKEHQFLKNYYEWIHVLVWRFSGKKYSWWLDLFLLSMLDLLIALTKKNWFFYLQWKLLMQNASYFTWKIIFIFEVLNFCVKFFSHLRRWFDKKAKFNFTIFSVNYWEINNYNTDFAQYKKSKGNQAMKFGQLIEYW